MVDALVKNDVSHFVSSSAGFFLLFVYSWSKQQSRREIRSIPHSVVSGPTANGFGTFVLRFVFRLTCSARPALAKPLATRYQPTTAQVAKCKAKDGSGSCVNSLPGLLARPVVRDTAPPRAFKTSHTIIPSVERLGTSCFSFFIHHHTEYRVSPN